MSDVVQLREHDPLIEASKYAHLSYGDLLVLQAIVNSLLMKKRKEAVDDVKNQIRSMGIKPEELNDEVQKATRKPAKAKYRSLKDPLTSTGQGRMAAWLKAEMEESGRPIEDFLIGANNAGA